MPDCRFEEAVWSQNAKRGIICCHSDRQSAISVWEKKLSALLSVAELWQCRPEITLLLRRRQRHQPFTPFLLLATWGGQQAVMSSAWDGQGDGGRRLRRPDVVDS